jgi:hypothetical protein
MAKKTHLGKAEQKKLAAKVKSLGARLEKAEARTAKWKAEAKQLAAEAVDKDTQLKRLKKLSRPEKSSETPQPAEPTQSAGPNETWTVTALRDSARTAGIRGYSRMTKPALLEALKKHR